MSDPDGVVRVEVAAKLKRWFGLYGKLNDDPPPSTTKRQAWWGVRFGVWNGLRNLSRHLGEWAVRNTPNVDPTALIELGGTACPLGRLPDDLLKHAWVSTRRLQAIVGTTRKSNRPPEELVATVADRDSGVMWRSATDLAQEFDVSSEALRKRLHRWRYQNGEGWMEVSSSERKSNEPHFLYRTDAVQTVIDALRKRR